jgi:Xaa-Pro dipeptidase
MNEQVLFERHINEQLTVLEKALSVFELEGLVLSAGYDGYYYQDDQEYPFRSSHHFRHYCPVEGAGHVIVLAPGKKPVLFYFCPENFWYDHSPVGEPFWIDSFEVKSLPSKDAIWKALAQYSSYGYLGPDNKLAKEHGFNPVPEALEHHLNWFRAYKTPYEADCVDRATQTAVPGHRAARAEFLNGGSEFDIHMAYLSATRMKDRDLPYTAIVGVDEKAAILHYPAKRDDTSNSRVLLIDSGAGHLGYASDITRTHISADVPAEFSSMLAAMDREQQALCNSITIGMNFGELFHSSHQAVGRVILEHGLLKGIDLDEAIDEGLTNVFYPHGVSHMLGIQVHDVGSKQLDLAGSMYVKDEKEPTKTTMRPIESGYLFTVEPGLYFMQVLLDKQRQGQHKDHFNWDLIDRLMPLGGIRIEDNIYVTEDGITNITRRHMPE